PRAIPNRVASRTAVSPMEREESGACSTNHGLGDILLPPIGTMLMDSVPPATITSAPPDMIRSAAVAIACKPEEQNRLIVMAEASIGTPARRDAVRATLIP